MWALNALKFIPCQQPHLEFELCRAGESCLEQKLSQQAGSSGARGTAEATKSSKANIVNAVWVTSLQDPYKRNRGGRGLCSQLRFP